jgi:hypothetical protein
LIDIFAANQNASQQSLWVTMEILRGICNDIQTHEQQVDGGSQSVHAMCEDYVCVDL